MKSLSVEESQLLLKIKNVILNYGERFKATRIAQEIVRDIEEEVHEERND